MIGKNMVGMRKEGGTEFMEPISDDYRKET